MVHHEYQRTLLHKGTTSIQKGPYGVVTAYHSNCRCPLIKKFAKGEFNSQVVDFCYASSISEALAVLTILDCRLFVLSAESSTM